LLGYLHWSLFDNYEWGTYAPRFGLYSLDYELGTERLPHDHYGEVLSNSEMSLKQGG
jgi:6-phospho-beta-galactosidase